MKTLEEIALFSVGAKCTVLSDTRTDVNPNLIYIVI